MALVVQFPDSNAATDDIVTATSPSINHHGGQADGCGYGSTF